MAQDKRHPKSTYDAKYPYNKVTVTESGHEVHMDCTPGKERLRWAHKAGTYREISPDGKQVEMVVGHNIQYVKGGHTQTVDKNTDVKVAGSTRSSVGGDSHSEVKGTSSTAISGDSKTVVGGDSVSAVKGDMVTGVKGKLTAKFGGGAQFKFDGDGEQKPVEMKVDQEFTLQVGKTLTLMSVEKIIFEVGSSSITITSDSITIKSPRVNTVGPTYLGLGDENDNGPRVVTEDGPAAQTFAKT